VIFGTVTGGDLGFDDLACVLALALAGADAVFVTSGVAALGDFFLVRDLAMFVSAYKDILHCELICYFLLTQSQGVFVDAGLGLKPSQKVCLFIADGQLNFV